MDDHQEDTDVVLIAENEKFPCSRKVLQAASPYFHAMFNSNMVESTLKEICLHNVDPSALKSLIDFASNGKFSVNHENVQILLEASSMLQFEEIFQSCCKFLMETVDVKTCVSLWVLADTLGVKILRQESKKCLLWNFLQVVQTHEFFTLSKNLLSELLHHNDLNCKDEVNVFKVIMKWMENNSNISQDDLLELLSCIRYCSLSNEDWDYIKNYPFITKQFDISKVLCKIFDHIYSHGIKEVENTADVVLLNNSHCDKLVGFTNFLTSSLAVPEESSRNDKLSSLIELLKTGKCTSCGSKLVLHFFSSSPRAIPLVPLTVRNYCKKIDSNPGEIPYKERRVQSTELHFLICDDTNAFKTLTSLTIGENYTGTLEGYGICSVGAVIYFFGGEYGIGSGRWNQDVYKFHIISQNWSIVTSLPVPRRHFLVVVLDEKIYILGGFGRYRLVLTSVDCYNTKTDQWESLSSLPCPLFSSAAVVAHQGNIYLFTSNVYCYTPADDTWHTVKKGHPLLGLSIGGAISYMNEIYLFPKFNGPLILYRPSNGTTEEMDFMQHRVFCVCIIKDIAYAFGMDMVVKFDLKEKKMESIELPELINADQCCTVPYYTIL